MLTIEQIVERLKDRNLTKVTAAVGLSYPVVHKIANGGTGNYDSVKALSDYLEANP
jgi:hypothetical protein